jgi:ACS family tartrate transporter-like MFS transporter
MNAAIGRDNLAERTRRHITRRLAPFLFLLYVLNYLDRVNISYAALQMTGDLRFSNAVFGFGAGIFFIGYFLLQLPATLLTEVWSARNFIGLTLILWGGLATLGGFVNTAQQFYWLRFFLGVAEAGFFPGVIVYLTHWYRHQDRGRAVAMFMTAIPMSNMLGAAVAARLMHLNWLGLHGWRWLLILEGFPATAAGVVTFFYLTDWPKDARWLPVDERDWISTELEHEKERKKSQTSLNPRNALTHPRVMILALAYFCYITNSVGMGSWLPKIVQRISGLGQTRAILISGIPWLLAIPAMLVLAAGNHLVFAIAAFSAATMALYSFPSPFWALPTIFLSGPAAAASIALINSMGNLGGFVGPYLIGYLADKTGGYAAGLLYLVICGLVGGALILSLRTGRPTTALHGNMETTSDRSR